MARNVNSTTLAEVQKPLFCPAFLVVLTFVSGTRYVWSGVGDLVFGGNTYQGVGDLGAIGSISEGEDVRADGTTVGLSGIDPLDLAESIADIKLGAPALIYFGAVSNGNTLVGTPYLIFRGVIDQPSETMSAETATIQLALENRMLDLQRPRCQRYTSADQALLHPTDMAFNWVEILNDIAFKEGQA